MHGDLGNLDQNACEAFVAEAQRTARVGSYKEKRRALTAEKNLRGFGYKARFSGQGAMTFSDPKAQEKLNELKSETTCNSCGEPGHWVGDLKCSNS